MPLMSVETLGIRLRSSDFYEGNRKSDLNRDNRRSFDLAQNEIRVSAIARKHIERLNKKRLVDVMNERERDVEQDLDRRGLLN